MIAIEWTEKEKKHLTSAFRITYASQRFVDGSFISSTKDGSESKICRPGATHLPTHPDCRISKTDAF